MVSALLYSVLRVLLDVLVTSHGDQAKLQAEVLVYIVGDQSEAVPVAGVRRSGL